MQGVHVETNLLIRYIQSDQKENTSEQALQIIIGHVVAESYANKRSMHGRRQFVSYLTNFRLWNYI
jgi:hypothetical protein